MSAITVREAFPTDAEAIARVDVDSHAAAYAALMPADYLARNTLELSTTRWRRILAGQGPWDRAPMKVYVALDDERVVGYVGLNQWRDDAGRDVGEVGSIYVAPDCWRRGAGHALMETALRWFREQRLAEATLWVLEGNSQARSFYETEGWAADGARQVLDIGGGERAEVRYSRRV